MNIHDSDSGDNSCKHKIVPKLPNISRVLKHDFPRRQYKKREKDDPVSYHWGQRKLFLVEMEFLTKYSQVDSNKKTIVIYAGAAPGTHINYLSKLFPYCQFILVDPSEFKVRKHKSIKIFNQYFTHRLAQQFADKYADRSKYNLLFMSDIRTANWRQMDIEENEEYIKKDNQIQLEWVQILQPDKAILKFRLPYQSGVTKYFPGDIYLSPWGPTRTTETRLVPSSYSDDQLIEYDQIKYEEQLYHFNTVTRMQEFIHNINGEGITFNYDSAAEIIILHDYLKWINGETPDVEEISRLSYNISRNIVKSSHRTLMHDQTDDDKHSHPNFKVMNHKNFYEIEVKNLDQQKED